VTSVFWSVEANASAFVFARSERECANSKAEALPPHSKVLAPYRLARDYAQTLLAHHYARRLPPELAEQLLHAVHHNLQHGESFADWSFA
jgi:hypothetical protein